MPLCAICGEDGRFFTDTCDENGRKRVFYLCAEHQRKFRLMTERFLEGRE